MSSFAIVFRREFVERRNVIFTALAASLIPILIPLLPSVPLDARAETRVMLAIYLGVTFAAGVAVAAGASLFSRDLADGRASFLFSRPIGHGAIWSGKVLAGVALALATFAIIAVPSLALQGTMPEGWKLENAPAVLALPIAAIAVLLLASNAVSVMVRSRRLLVLADFVFAIIVAASAWTLGIQFVPFASRISLIFVFLTVITAIITVALLAGSYAQTALARTDIRRAHTALSLTVWSILFSALALLAILVFWLPRFGPEDIKRVGWIRSGSASWVVVDASGVWRPEAFASTMIIDAANPERYLRVPPGLSGSIEFSRDGRRAAWLERDFDTPWNMRSSRRYHLVIADLETKLVVRRTELPVKPWARLVLSDDGRHVALWEQDAGQVSAFETDSLRSLGSAQLRAHRVRMYFTETGELRIIAFDGPYSTTRVDLLTWRLASRQMIRTGIIPESKRIVANSSGAKLLVDSESGVALHDGATGARIAVLAATEPERQHSSGTYLTDGRIVIAWWSPEESRLLVFDAEGTPLRKLALPRTRRHSIADQVSADVVLVRSTTDSHDEREYRTLAVDLRSGRVTHQIEDTVPTGIWRRYAGTDPRAYAPDAHCLWNPEAGSVGRLDPATWKVFPLFGGRS
jgi:hypothetical protein